MESLILCSRCKAKLEPSVFLVRPNRRGSRGSWCNTCRAADQRLRQDRAAASHDAQFYAGLDMTQTKRCSRCATDMVLTEFDRSARSADGMNGQCRRCRNASRNPVKERAANKAWRRSNPERSMLMSARASAKKRGLAFDLMPSDIQIPDVCPVLGISLVGTVGAGDRCDGTPTLDRIDNLLGYVPGNVIVISWRANRLKSDATLAELQMIADFYGTLVTMHGPHWRA